MSDGGDADSSTDADSDAPHDPDTAEILDDLFSVIESRKENLPEGSYTASLLTHEKGENAVLEKLGEETTELILAAKDDDEGEMAHEAADIVYHMLVLLSMKDVDLEDLRAELRNRY